MRKVFQVLSLCITFGILFTRCDKGFDPEIVSLIQDQAFLNALIEQGVDVNGDNLISYKEAEAIFILNVSRKDISDISGITAFSNLDSLNCSRNQLTSLDISNNTLLTFLDCSGNQLASLDITNNSALIDLNCGGTMCCGNNKISSLDLSNCTALRYLDCAGNRLTSLDVSNCTALSVLYFTYNQITNLDISKNMVLTELNCGLNQLTNLDVSTNTMLTNLYCFDNQLTSLDVSNNTALNYLIISNMPMLNEVCVWTVPFPPPTVELLRQESPNISFTTECTPEN